MRRILQNCEEGKWAVPKFQRYFSWDRRNIRDFLESIFDDYYVGSLLFWDISKDEDFPIDVMVINGVQLQRKGLNPDLIILDGQQRITSLYYAIRSPSDVELEGSKKPVYFYFDFLNYFKDQGDERVITDTSRLDREETFKRMWFPVYELEKYSDWTVGFEAFFDVF